MKYWLIKSEPKTYSWDDFVALGQDHWDGVRNYQARNNMKEMKIGDQALFYHSNEGKCAVGIAEVVREFYPDPTTDDERWVVVDFVPVRKLKRTVSLSEIKKDPKLASMVLVNNSRLSVQPVTEDEFKYILKLSEKT